MSIKRLVFSNSKALIKNTTRMGGDFLSNQKGPDLLLGQEHGGTFAREIRQKHTGFLNTKSKGSNDGLFWYRYKSVKLM